MTHPIAHESKHIAKRVVIGVTTAVCTSAIIYFLGYNRSSPASEAQIKKNTIEAWKALVVLENKEQPKYDSSLAQIRRSAITYDEYRRLDSMHSVNFSDALIELRKRKDIDKSLVLLLDQRIENKQQELRNFFAYFNSFKSIADSTTITIEAKAYLISQLNNDLNGKRNNYIERAGRSIEDISKSLARKYKYPFSVTDFAWYYYYQTLKEARQEAVRKLQEQPAPPNPTTAPGPPKTPD